MQIELRVKWFDSDWSGQIVFLLLFSNKGKSLSLSKCITNAHKVGLQSGIGAEGFGTGALRQKRWSGRVRGRGGARLCWNLSKANNHSGAEEEYYIRAWNQYHITLSMGVYTRLIKLIIFDATMAVSFGEALDNNYCSIIGAVCELKKTTTKKTKNKYNKTNGYLFD